VNCPVTDGSRGAYSSTRSAFAALSISRRTFMNLLENPFWIAEQQMHDYG
jgi:hypothetical protein